jgi:glycosyltransferase involved in cell wall biosynthesis
VLYVCYLSLDDPLVHTQVVAYLRELTRAGHVIHLLTYETRKLSRAERTQRREALAAAGISWHHLHYHKRPSLPATVYDALAGAVRAVALVARHRLDAIHARSHVPAATALVASAAVRSELIFDIRGLMAEEYEDAGRWSPGGLPSRITKWIERKAIARAAGVVVLTERVRTFLFGQTPDPRVAVIPCCADTDAILPPDDRSVAKRRLGVPAGPTLVYVGKFSGWYMEHEMARFFVLARRHAADLHFLVLTQSDPGVIATSLKSAGAPHASYTVKSVPAPEVAGQLQGADAAISFIRPSLSKISASPTKIGEYLSAGLPVAYTTGVGDLDALLTPKVGVGVSAFDDRTLEQAALELLALAAEPATTARCRALAEERLSLRGVGGPAYRDLYEWVASELADHGQQHRRQP